MKKLYRVYIGVIKMNKKQLRDFFSAQAPSQNILGDKITKPQKKAMKKQPFGDWDGDNVINGLDCAPRNKKKHGWDFGNKNFEQAKEMRDEAIENHYKEKGYYKYGGPDRMQKDDLDEGSQSFFGKNPVRRFTGMTSRIKR